MTTAVRLTRGKDSWDRRLRPRVFEPATEARYRADYAARFAPLRIRTQGFVMPLWLVYLFWDYTLGRSDPQYQAMAPILMLVRVVVFLGQLGFFWLTSQPRFAQDDGHANRVLIVGNMFTFAGMCLITGLAPYPYDLLYFFMGVMVIMIGGSTLFGLRTRESLLLACAQLACALVLNVWCSDYKAHPVDLVAVRYYPWLVGTFLTCFAVMGCVTSGLFEAMTRILFQSREATVTASLQAQERMQAVIDLKEQLRQTADHESREKSKFIATAVHDLRQPVQAISSTLAPVAMALEKGDHQAALTLLDITRRSVELMHAQLGAILDVSRIESGYVQPRLDSVELGGLIANVLEQAQPLAQAQQVRMRRPELRSPVWVRTDAQFLARILSNLVNNSIKYSDASGSKEPGVHLFVHRQAGYVRLDVEDNGIGMDQALIDRGDVFRPFFQAAASSAVRNKGVGLGLAIVRGLMAALPDHALQVRSQPGQGSVFSITVPAAPSLDAGVPGAVQALSPLGAGPLLGGRYLLLIEDDQLVRLATQHLLESQGARVEAYASYAHFREALETVERVPDAILSDYELPQGHTALDVIQAARGFLGETGALVFSGRDLTEDVLAQLGGIPFLRKPVTGTRLLEALHAVIASSPVRASDVADPT